MKPLIRPGLSILLIALFTTQPASAFSHPLSPEAIREAYFLATGDSSRMAEAFAKYTRTFSPPKEGPYVATIEFETPYVVVANEIAMNPTAYLAPDAEEKFLGKPETCRVLVQVYFPFNDDENVTLQLLQNDKEIAIQSVQKVFLDTETEPPFAVGIEIDADYSADKVDADKSATVEVTLENGQQVETEFDLLQLR